MQFIVHTYNNNSANSSSRSSPMSISSTSSIASTQANSMTLPHLEPPSPVPSARTFGSPTPRKLTFSTAEHIEPIRLRPIKCEDADSEDESLPVMQPTNITLQHPTEVSIKVKHFESIHNARETEAKQSPPVPDTNTNTNANTTSTDAPLTNTEAAAALMVLGTTTLLEENEPRQLHCSRQIDWLRCILANSQPPEQNTTDATVAASSRSSGWDYNNDSELEHLWPKPPMTPPEGDDMHPSQMSVCGVHPRQG